MALVCKTNPHLEASTLWGVIVSMYLGVVLSSRFNKKSLIRWKVYIDRSKMYMGYIQFLLIIFVTIESLGENPVKEFVFTSPMIALPIILVFHYVFY